MTSLITVNVPQVLLKISNIKISKAYLSFLSGLATAVKLTFVHSPGVSESAGVNWFAVVSWGFIRMQDQLTSGITSGASCMGCVVKVFLREDSKDS